MGKETLLQRTFRRTRKIFSLQNILIATNIRHAPLITHQLGGLPIHYSYEPAKRETAAAIGLAAIRIAKKDPHEILFTVNADHVVLDESAYRRTAGQVEAVIKKNPGYSVLVGIEPTYPETGYGYIKLSRRYQTVGRHKIYYADRFIEKPDIAHAKLYVKRWEYLWNPAMFAWRVDTLLELYKKFMPVHYRILMNIQRSLGTAHEASVIKKEFPKMPAVSIDYGIMEKLKKMLVVPASLGWADIGHWRTVHEMMDSDPGGNTVRGKHVGVATHNSMILNFSDKLVATAGVEDLLVINTQDAVLVCDREHAQDVKKIVEIIKKKKWLRYL